jgi:hypothetical protein
LSAFALAILLCLGIASVAPAGHVLLFLTGTGLGAVLYRSVFGFTSAFRVLLADRRSAGFRARIVLLGAGYGLWGGLFLGYGARLAYGCNIGACFSGIASGSLHGWLWIAFALLGTRAGMRLRPVFGISHALRSTH